MKATMRNGKGSAYHNDRTYENATVKEKEEVKYTKTAVKNCENFHDAELQAYKLLYGNWLKKRNEKYEQRRQYKNIKDMDDILGGTNQTKTKGRYEPVETILQIGKDGDNIPLETFQKCITEFVHRIQRKYRSNMLVLDVAIHTENSSVPHAHIRRTWFAHDKDGDFEPSKKGALKELGFDVNNSDRYNNATVKQTEEERQIWYELLKEHGFNIDTIADLDNTEHFTTKEYKRIKKAKEEEIAKLNERIAKLNEEIESKNKAVETADKKIKEFSVAFDDETISLEDMINKGRIR